MADVSSVSVRSFGKTPNSQHAQLFTLRNLQGMYARVTKYGGILTARTAPDRSGVYADVVLGHDALEGYLSGNAYLGALIGRCANRIAKGRLSIGDRTYRLATNDPPKALHGGCVGFDKQLWAVDRYGVTA